AGTVAGRAAGVEGQMRRTGYGYCAAEIHCNRDRCAGSISAIGGGRTYVGDRVRREDDKALVGAQRAGTAGRSQRQRGGVVVAVLDRAAVKRQGGSGHIIQQGTVISGGHSIGKAERVCASAGTVAGRAARVEGKLRRAGYGHRTAEVYCYCDRCPGRISPILVPYTSLFRCVRREDDKALVGAQR